ncbi:MAG: DAK2 domain-containing protein [Bacillota bacterium]
MAGNGNKGGLLSGNDLRAMFLQATDYFEQHKEIINDLNVFPVPDGDTGTNMVLTLQAASQELLDISSTLSIGEIARIAARSSLMGARGNSGVILSQLFQGIARGLAGKEEAGLPELGRAFQYGIVYAYNAVSRPVEGTILTVAREIAKGSRDAVQKSINIMELLDVAIESGKKALGRTPDLLPVLKEAGVVDAGGLGLIVFLEGCLKSLSSQSAGSSDAALLQEGGPGKTPPVKTNSAETSGEKINLEESFDSRFPYCTELIIKGDGLSTRLLRDHLQILGESLLLAGDEEAIKVHIHTANPGKVLETCLACGSIHDIKIDNMLDQFSKSRWSGNGEQTGKKEATEAGQTVPVPSTVEIGVIVVAAGSGFASIFSSMGADRVVSGGQSMNPPVKDIVDAIMEVNAERIIVLPNNSNVQFAAEQAAKLVDKEVSVIDAHSMPQGLAAITAFDRRKSLADNFVEMCLRARQVKTLEVTYATRDAQVSGIAVKKGDIIGLAEGVILFSGLSVDETVQKLLRAVIGKEEQIVTLFYGEEITENNASELAGKLVADHPDIEVELQYGGQPLYYYLISVE